VIKGSIKTFSSRKKLGKSSIMITQRSRNLHSIVLGKYRQKTRFFTLHLSVLLLIYQLYRRLLIGYQSTQFKHESIIVFSNLTDVC